MINFILFFFFLLGNDVQVGLGVVELLSFPLNSVIEGFPALDLIGLIFLFLELHILEQLLVLLLRDVLKLVQIRLL
jgi:hypothetical protein